MLKSLILGGKDELINMLIFKKYRLIKKIGKGSFGFVYSAENIKDKNMPKVAVKLEEKTRTFHLLEKESNFLLLLNGVGIPKIISYGYNSEYFILIQELLGKNLIQIVKSLKIDKFNIKDIAMIALQVIDRMEYIHSKNVVHRDIKPENFLIGLKNEAFIYLIDFGISRKYRSSKTGKHIQFSLSSKFFGTLDFISYNATRGVEQTRRDDMISVGYMLIHLSGTKLPWEHLSIKGKNAKKNYEKILELKKLLKPENICEGLPVELAEYIRYCYNLNFEQKPDYEYLRGLFKNLLSILQCKNYLNFSWLNKINLNKKGQNKKSITCFKKCTNLLIRKQSPHIRLFKKVEKNLKNVFFYNKIVQMKNKEKENKAYNNLKKSLHIVIIYLIHVMKYLMNQLKSKIMSILVKLEKKIKIILILKFQNFI